MLERIFVPGDKSKEVPEKPKGVGGVADHLMKYAVGKNFSFTPEEEAARIRDGKPVNADAVAERITREVQKRNAKEALKSLREKLNRLPGDNSTLDKTN